jgi:hypothetical protein
MPRETTRPDRRKAGPGDDLHQIIEHRDTLQLKSTGPVDFMAGSRNDVPMVTSQSAEVDWLTLVYRVPRQPSTPRIAIWRRLRALGVAQLGDGVVALPQDARTREHLDWVADRVVDAGAVTTPSEATRTLKRLGKKLRAIQRRDSLAHPSATSPGLPSSGSPTSLPH